MYQKIFKRILDIIVAAGMLIVFCWLYAIVALLVRINLGSPVIFRQARPGRKGPDGKEKIFYLYKFRTMNNARDKQGKLLSDAQRLKRFGMRLRDTSLDELPEAWNILKGDMSVIGPRPLLVRDMTIMTEEQRRRHDVTPGLSGLAQISGRNGIDWEKRLDLDLKYTEKITFFEDIRIALVTVGKVFKAEHVNSDGMATSEDLGDYLLRTGKIDRETYDRNQAEAERLLAEMERTR